MYIIRGVIPFIVFILIYVFGGKIFFGNESFVIPCNVAIFPAIFIAWLLSSGSQGQKLKKFISGSSQDDLVGMCIIFLLSGGFGYVTKTIGCVESIVNLILTYIPPNFLMIGLFLCSSLLSTSIGSSMGTIAALAPIFLGLGQKSGIPLDLVMGVLVGGAMFGDNLSLISDTTIASVNTQNANLKKKFNINLKIGLVSFILSSILLIKLSTSSIHINIGSYNLLLITPYIILFVFMIFKVNIYMSLLLSIFYSGIIGMYGASYEMKLFVVDISKGFSQMYELIIFCLLLGGLSGLTNENISKISDAIVKIIPNNKYSSKIASLVIAKIASIFDIFLANNTIAILLCGDMAKKISKKYNIDSNHAAAWIDIFSCVFQGIIPYGAQILLAASYAQIDPIAISKKVHYCYILGIVSILYILFVYKSKKED